MKYLKNPTLYFFGLLCLAAAQPLSAGLLVYEPFNYGVAGADRASSDLFNGQPDGVGDDVDAIGLGGTWVDATNNDSGAMFLSADSLAFGNFATLGNHVRSDTNSNSDRFHRPITAELVGGNGELWISFLANKLQNNFNAAREGIAFADGILNDARFDEVNPSGLQGFGIGPVADGTAWTAYGWDGTAAVAGGASLSVATNGSQTVLLVGQIQYDAGAAGADIFTLYHYTLNAGEMSGGELVEITSIEVDVDQSQLDTLNLTRQVNTAFDEIRIGTTLNDVLALNAALLVGTTPASGALDVPVYADLEAFFNKNVLLTGEGSVTLRNLTLGASEDTVITLPDPRVSVEESTLTISPDANLDSETQYAVQISADSLIDASDIAFDGILDDSTWTFTTGVADANPPVVASLAPEVGSMFVAPSAVLAASFDKEVVLGSGEIRIKNLTAATQTVITVPGPQVSVSGDTLTITPAANLAAGADFEVEIDAGVVVDLFGNAFEGLPTSELSWTFTTGVPPQGLLVYEGFQYEEPGDSLQGQPTDPSGTDTDATGITGEWTDEETSSDNRLFLKEGSLSFGDLVVRGNHVGSATNANQDRFHRTFTSNAQLGIAGNAEIWFSFLAEKPQNDNSQAREGVAITNQVIGDPRLMENDGSDGLIGFGVGPTSAGTNWTAYAWNGSSRISGTEALSVGIGVEDIRLLVGHIAYDSGPGGTDAFTLYEYQLGPDGIIEGGTLSQIGDTIHADVNQATLTTLNVTRRVNTNYDEIRIGTSFEDVVPAYTYEDWVTLYPDADLSDPNADYDGDGLSNLEEFEQRSNPTLPDTDGDGLLDGVNLSVTDEDARYADFAAMGIVYSDAGGTRTFLGENSLGTDPLSPDSDGVKLIDGESLAVNDTDPRYTEWAAMGLIFTDDGGGLRTFIGELTVGTDPLNPDTDGDALPDGEEVTLGTNPLNPDSDNDGAGDWYEVYASLTDPLDPNDKPNVPYPLPDPDGSTGTSDKPVKVYIMSGQSNMVGFGNVSGPGDDTLETMTLRQNKFPNLIDGTGEWTTLQNVRYRGVISDIANAQLSPGALGATFGPELGFGYIMAWHHDEPVLLIKSCTGNRSLGWDILPPGSPSYVYNDTNYAGYGDFGNWPVGEEPPPPGGWYAGKEFDRFFMDEADWAHDFPADFNVVDVLDNFATEYPDWANQGFEIAGFVWWQGDKDRYDLAYATRYEQNLVGLIDSLRDYYTNRYPGKVADNAPFVLATLGQTALDSTNTADKAILDAHLAVDGEAGNYPEYAGNVKTVYSHPLSEGGASNGHYSGRAGTYMLVGDALGRAMVELLEGTSTPPPVEGAFGDWADTFPGLSNPDPTLDFDGGGLSTALEWVLGGDPTDASDDAGIVPTIDTESDPDGKLRFTFRRSAEAAADPGTTILVEYGSDLVGWTAATHQGVGPNDITVTETTDGFGTDVDAVTVAIPASLADDEKLFVRLNVAVVID